VKDATTEAETIRRWWAQYPYANIGVATGPESGLFVLDVDPRSGGKESLSELERLHGPLPATVQSQTGGGGAHYLFQYPTDGTVIGNATSVAGFPGLDIKGDGGFIVVPPSIHATGARYEWVNPPDRGALAVAPDWLLSLLRRGGSPPTRNRPSPGEKVAEGGRNTHLHGLGRSMYARGAAAEAIQAALLAENTARCQPPLPEVEVERTAEKAATQPDRHDFRGAARPLATIPSPKASVWDSARAAPEFVTADDTDEDWLEHPIAARGSITEIFSPRGIGKTHFVHALAVRLARRDVRVLLLDRDNSRREIRRRLEGWGAGQDDASNLKVLTRDQAPPLTDREAWARFPVEEYDFVIIDALDSSAEGMGEKDSGKPSQAIASILDLAHRADGPAILVLGNTVKTGVHGRGCGVIEDRADICFEVRDATDLKPTGKKEWWKELPEAGAESWADRAKRRKRRATYRLAFVASKFRVGEEPEPFLREIDLSSSEWRERDVTEDVLRAVSDALATEIAATVAKRDKIGRQLAEQISQRCESGNPMLAEKDAVPFLTTQGLTRADARKVVQDGEKYGWRIRQDTHAPGRPCVLLPLSLTDTSCPSAETKAAETARETGARRDEVYAAVEPQSRCKSVSGEPLSHKGFLDGQFPPNEVRDDNSAAPRTLVDWKQVP
jgi:putative DNA primase/helicase